jgi:acyl-CoA hydrolase
VVRHTASAYLTFVSLDAQGRPMKIPELVIETAEQKRRNAEAAARRNLRMKRG